MTKIVGIDFGTSNVRITQWDADSGENPSSCAIGEDSSSVTMPAVIAFERQPDGNVVTTFGEEADALGDGGPDAIVVRNIKRWALTTDAHVRQQLAWHLERQSGGNEQPLPEWLALNPPSIRLWNDTMTAADAIKEILKEAISRSELAGSIAEWRAGCPVDSDLAYRKALESALEDLGCGGRIEWISEEPLLLIALGRETGVSELQEDGHYLVYDLGGGSFDCSVVEVRQGQMAILANEGLPMGGMDIDKRLMDHLDYDVPIQELRIAKEQLYSDDAPDEIPLSGDQKLTRKDICKVLTGDTPSDKGFIDNFIDETLRAAVNAYNKAQILMSENESTGGWQLNLDSMKGSIEKVLVVGGPTKMPYFTDRLEAIFGEEKVMTADKLTQSANRADIVDPELTALSFGACYMLNNSYIPLAVDRIPAKITLRVTDGQTVEEDSYEPFARLSARRALAPYEGRLIIRRDPYNQVTTALDPTADSTYSVLVTGPDGDTLYESEPREMRMPRDGYTGPRADRIKLVVDRLGGVKVMLGAGFLHVPSPLEDTVDVIENPQWQVDLRTESEVRATTALLDSYDTSQEAAYGDGGRRNRTEGDLQSLPQRRLDTSREAAYGDGGRRNRTEGDLQSLPQRRLDIGRRRLSSKPDAQATPTTSGHIRLDSYDTSQEAAYGDGGRR